MQMWLYIKYQAALDKIKERYDLVNEAEIASACMEYVQKDYQIRDEFSLCKIGIAQRDAEQDKAYATLKQAFALHEKEVIQNAS